MEKDKEKVKIKMIERFVDLKYQNVLEIGCGDGRVSTLLARNSREYVAIDPDRELIKDAQTLTSNVDFQIGTGEALEFMDETFDVVLFTLSLHHHQNRRLTLEEANRVLTRDGKLIIIEPVSDGELQQIIYLFDDETDLLAETLDVIEQSSFDLVNQETFGTNWTFNNQKELCSYLFERTSNRSDDCDRILKKYEQLKGPIIDDQPIHLQEKMQILLLQKNIFGNI